jgi:hypothetical protein
MQGRKGPEDDCFVGRPGGPRHQGRCAPSQTEKRLVRRDPPHPLGHAVEPGIAQHSDAIDGDTEPGQPGGILHRDCPGGSHRLISRLEQPPGRPAQPPTTRAHRSGHYGHLGTGRRRAGGQLGPDIQFGKDQ